VIFNQSKENTLNKTRTSIDYVLPTLVLVILLIYTYAKFFKHPYTGFRMDSRGNVFLIFVEQELEPALQIGDHLIKVNSQMWEDFRADLQKTIFDDIQPGQIINLLVQRGDSQLLIPWKSAGPNPGEVRDLALSEGWLGFFFWFVGTFALLTLRPKDERWRLFIAFNYLTGIFLTLGSGVSFYHIWESAILLRIAVWFCVPVYLHLHWVFPKPLRPLPPYIIWLGYLSAGILSMAEWLQLLPQSLYFVGFLVAVMGSIVLLIIHAIKQPETRSDLKVLFSVILIAFLPSIAVGIIGGFVAGRLGQFHPWISGGALLSLPLFPLAYFYAVYRRRLGSLELRVNDLLSSYLFMTLISAVVLPPITFIGMRFSSVGAAVILGSLAFLLASFIVLFGYSPFQSVVERRVFDIPLPSKRLLEVYSARITTSDLLSDLVRVLETEIIPSLLIRQFVFLQSDNGTLKVLSKLGVNEEQIPKEQDMPALLTQPGVYRSPDLAGSDQPYSWIRLVLPLKLGEETIGFWLFGRRDPDDIYSQLEIPILQSLASQTAIALSNILQTQRLKSMYEGNIDRYEKERLRLSRDLHDSVMNEMAALLMREDAPVFSPDFQQAFEALTERLREIVTDLRPPSLTFGLKTALEDLADGLSERNREKVKVVVDIQSDEECRYPDNVENHVYRIVQEACGNALKYAHAKTIKIAGRLFRQKIELTVEDDGVGFEAESKPNLDETHASKHYGLTGMHERAHLIGAKVDIDAKPGRGTRIQVIWESKETI
jgi:signal transduction histidine kinase